MLKLQGLCVKMCCSCLFLGNPGLCGNFTIRVYPNTTDCQAPKGFPAPLSLPSCYVNGSSAAPPPPSPPASVSAASSSSGVVIIAVSVVGSVLLLGTLAAVLARTSMRRHPVRIPAPCHRLFLKRLRSCLGHADTGQTKIGLRVVFAALFLDSTAKFDSWLIGEGGFQAWSCASFFCSRVVAIC